MPQALIGGVLIVHGLITTAIGAGTAGNPGAPAMAAPGWLAWWPGPFGRSWLIDGMGLGSGAAVVGGIAWLAAGALLVAAGLGWFGIAGLHGWWQPLSVTGAAVGLLALALYFHPLYLIGIAIDVAILVAMSRVLETAR